MNLNNYSFFFGNAENSIRTQEHQGKDFLSLLDNQAVRVFCEKNKIKKIFFGKQVHGFNGFIIDHTTDSWPLFEYESDFLITHVADIALGIITADCLPIIIVDDFLSIVSIIHAGWKGLVAGILQNVIALFKKQYASQACNLKVFIGSYARVCCYQVSADFLQNTDYSDCVVLRDEFFFADLLKLSLKIFNQHAIYTNQIDLSYAVCTICNKNFCSFRRSFGSLERQISLVSLKSNQV